MLSGGWTALMYACSYGEDDIVKYLVNNGADALAHKGRCAAKQESNLIASWHCLLAAHQIITFCFNSAQCRVQDFDLSRPILLINSSAFSDMFTALMAACASRRDCEPRLLHCCTHLVKYGADVNSAEKHLMTPLMFAARENRATIVAFLLENGADVNAKDCRLWTVSS